MEAKESIYSEIGCDYLNPEGYWTVDAWMTDADNKEGKVIAAIDSETAKVFYVDDCAHYDSYAQEIISAKRKEILNGKDDDHIDDLLDSVQV